MEDGVRRDSDDKQGSPLSVDMRLVPWCVGGMAALAVLWTALVVWNETQYGEHANWTLACEAIGGKVLFAVPGIVLIPIILATGTKLAIKLGKDLWRVINFNFPLIGGKYIERRISEWRDEGLSEGIEIGESRGIVKGRAEERAEWSAWNKRRIEAQRDDLPFDEPPPDDSR